MKKFIRFIARISGVEKQIRDEKEKQIASDIMQASYWMSSGERLRAGNALFMYSRLLTDCGHVNHSNLRDQLDSIGDESLFN